MQRNLVFIDTHVGMFHRESKIKTVFHILSILLAVPKFSAGMLFGNETRAETSVPKSNNSIGSDPLA
jgi:hypothetical protein